MKLKSKHNKPRTRKVFGIIDFAKKSKRWDNIVSDPVGDIESFISRIARGKTDRIMEQAKNMAETNTITLQEAMNKIYDAMQNQTTELSKQQKEKLSNGFVTVQEAAQSFRILGSAFKEQSKQFESAIRSMGKRDMK